MSRYGASTFSSLLKDCVLWAPLQHSAGVSGDIDEFPIIPSGVTVTNNGTFTKTSLGNNKSVMKFDGSTNVISLADNSAWDFGAGDFTICYWVKIPTAGVLYRIMGRLPANLLYPLNWYTGINENGFSFLSAYNTDVIYETVNANPSTVPANTWTHIAFTKYGSSLYGYINAISGTPTTAIALTDTAEPLVIGRNGAFPANMLNGNIKDLMIYKGRALTQPEIKLLMNRTHPETGAGLMPANGDYYKLS